ncbi:MAG: SDR family NAD(P)-dependent oxidoreductase, partial [Phycisphaeraceae bacterium]
MSTRLDGRVALVTGGSRGLGEAVADKLGENGATVAVNYVANVDRAQAVVEHIRGRGGTAVAFQADIRDEQQINQMVADIEHNLGAIDILVPNATG